jgi:hypothetical protein
MQQYYYHNQYGDIKHTELQQPDKLNVACHIILMLVTHCAKGHVSDIYHNLLYAM